MDSQILWLHCGLIYQTQTSYRQLEWRKFCLLGLLFSLSLSKLPIHKWFEYHVNKASAMSFQAEYFPLFIVFTFFLLLSFLIQCLLSKIFSKTTCRTLAILDDTYHILTDCICSYPYLCLSQRNKRKLKHLSFKSIVLWKRNYNCINSFQQSAFWINYFQVSD